MKYCKFDYDIAINEAYIDAYKFEQESDCGKDYYLASDTERKKMARKALLTALQVVGYSDLADKVVTVSILKKWFEKDVNTYVKEMLNLFSLTYDVEVY